MKYLENCWRFDDSLPPIYFRPGVSNVDVRQPLTSHCCPSCKKTKLTRVTFWRRTVLPLRAVWQCNSCNKYVYLEYDDWRAIDLPTIGPQRLLNYGELMADVGVEAIASEV